MVAPPGCKGAIPPGGATTVEPTASRGLDGPFAASPADALMFGVNNGPAKPLHELRCGVRVAEMICVDELVKQDRGVRAFLLRRNDDSGHSCSLTFRVS